MLHRCGLWKRTKSPLCRLYENVIKRMLALLATTAILATALPNLVQIVSAESREMTVYRYLKEEMSLNTAATCGIMANLQKESNFNPNCSFTESGGFVSYGLCQWNRERLTALKNYCSNHGYDYQSLTGQLHYMQYELETSELSAYNKVRNVSDTPSGAYDAGYNWAKYFERCSEWYQGVHQYSQRAELAKNTYWPRYHVHSYSSSVTEQPGCTTTGVRTYSCSCGASSYTEILTALGHNWSTWAITTVPTCTVAGISMRSCSRCGQQETQTIQKNEHQYSSQTILPTCTENGYDLHTCSVCGNTYTDSIIPATGHNFIRGVCTVCGAVDPSVLKGDLNLDGQITSADTVMMARYLIDLVELNEAQLTAADMNSDGVITSADTVLLARKLLE